MTIILLITFSLRNVYLLPFESMLVRQPHCVSLHLHDDHITLVVDYASVCSQLNFVRRNYSKELLKIKPSSSVVLIHLLRNRPARSLEYPLPALTQTCEFLITFLSLVVTNSHTYCHQIITI